MPQHVHLVVARHRLRIEQICNLLKGEATKQLNREGQHPMAAHAEHGKLPSMWEEGFWEVFLDTDDGIRSAIRYVEENPLKGRKPAQRWSFVTSFN